MVLYAIIFIINILKKLRSFPMLRIGKLTDYALLILSQMAKWPETVFSATVLAETLHLTPPTVSKILKILSDAQLVSSLRGAEGGYRLARLAKTISVADIITAMEGELAMTECCEHADLCGIKTVCTMRENWLKINKRIYTLLAGFSLDDMLTPLSPTQLL